jgi:LacI family transcriptional regulator
MASTGEQIARMAGVSVSTVSRVLNNSGPVSAHARKSILDAMKASGSVPRVLGPRMATRTRRAKQPTQGGLIDVVMIRRTATPATFFDSQNRVASAYFRHLVDAVIAQMQRLGFHAVVRVCEELPAELSSSDARAMILLGDYRDNLDTYVHSRKLPVVSFTFAEKGDPIDYVGIDNFTGMSAMFDHVYGLGHRKIGYIAGTMRPRVNRERLSFFKMKMAEASLQINPDWLYLGHCDMNDDVVAAERILRLSDRPTAMLCCYDGAAVAVKRAADVVGISIPGDLSVVGHDDQGLQDLFTPGLTNIRVPVMQMAKHAMDILMMRLTQKSAEQLPPCRLRVTPSLIVRESTAPPKTRPGDTV